ncbi:MAG: rane-bound metal-dependent hydrolase [Bryobacterales bacterium]|nr:rane-bound metal-dependent hydrolase [Bryobacterales bacterium]
MDNATHTLTGLFLSRAGLNRLTPSATPILLISANFPDCDVVSAIGGAANYLHWHRNITHSLLLGPLLALLTVGIFRLARRRIAFGPAFLVALAGIASHLLLDMTNIYGVRLLLPFSGKWFRWDLTPVIDFWIWGVFLVCLGGPFLSRLVSSEIGAGAKRKYPGRGFALLALVFLITYNLSRMVLHTRAVGMLEGREYENSAPIRVAAFPLDQNPLLWKGVAETPDAYHLFRINLLSRFDPAQGEIASKPDPSPAIDAANRTYAFQVMREFAVFPLYRVIPAAESEGAVRVELSDLRFPFTSVALVDRENRVQKAAFQFGPQ